MELRNKVTGEVRRVPFRCKSWRCQDCRREVAARDFARVYAALSPLPVDELVYLVATLDQRADAARGMTKQAAYGASLLRRLKSFIQWIRRNHDRGARYVLTVEQHRSGWPHVNVILHAPELAASLAKEKKRKDGLAPRWLRDEAVSCNLGPRMFAEAADDIGALAGYIVKVTEAPWTAPKRMRRLRASKGFLPRRWSMGENTGMLLESGMRPCA